MNGKAHSENFKRYYKWGNLQYKGNIVQGLYEGYGELYNINGNIKYKGPFMNSIPHGDNGVFYHKKTGKVKYYGSVIYGLYDGYGTRLNKNEQVIESGVFVNGFFSHGFVNLYNENSQILEYSGQCTSGKYWGHGVLYHRNGQKLYQGKFVNGNRDGQEIVEYDPYGNICFIGSVSDGEKVGKSENFVYDEIYSFSNCEDNETIQDQVTKIYISQILSQAQCTSFQSESITSSLFNAAKKSLFDRSMRCFEKSNSSGFRSQRNAKDRAAFEIMPLF